MGWSITKLCSREGIIVDGAQVGGGVDWGQVGGGVDWGPVGGGVDRLE